MAKIQSIDLPWALKNLFPDRLIRLLARGSGLVIRERKVKAVPFFWNLIEVEVLFPRRTYGGHCSRARERYRLVAIRDEKTGKYHTYITNVPPDLFSAEAIASGYRARWLIELVFKELKSGYRIDQVPSGRRQVAEAFLYAGILTLLASRKLFRLLAAEEDGHRFRVGRWWSIFAANAYTLLHVVLHPRQGASLLNNFLKTLRHELVDPHRRRAPLLIGALG